MEHGSSGATRAIWKLAVRGFGLSVLASSSFLSPPALAMHEVDHRFSVEGYVCGPDGRATPDVQVIVKDARVSEGASAYTDSRGYYKATLHLHNENQGDAILVKALNEEQRVTAQFDPKDARTERIVTVNFGTECDKAAAEEERWLYYGAGIGLAAVIMIAGAAWFKRQRPSGKKSKKGQGKR